ncbi:MAG: lipocalin family protein [Muribaculaceae bacterium]|nr:lipocalin family protein [Muribaculaceae bacterium]
MKKLLTLILMLLPMVAVLTGCNDKDEPVDYSSKLVGTWVAERSTTNENLNMTVSIESIWAFKNTGNCTWTIYSKLNGKVIESRENSYKYSYNGNELSLTANGQTSKLSAVLKGNTLTIITNEGTTLTHYKR